MKTEGSKHLISYILCVCVVVFYVYLLYGVFASRIIDKHKNSIIKINSINEHHMLLAIFILIGMPFMRRAFGIKQNNQQVELLIFSFG